MVVLEWVWMPINNQFPELFFLEGWNVATALNVKEVRSKKLEVKQPAFFRFMSDRVVENINVLFTFRGTTTDSNSEECVP